MKTGMSALDERASGSSLYSARYCKCQEGSVERGSILSMYYPAWFAQRSGSMGLGGGRGLTVTAGDVCMYAPSIHFPHWTVGFRLSQLTVPESG